MVSVFLGSVGWPGTFLFLVWVWLCIWPARFVRRTDPHRVFVAARVVMLPQLTGALLSATMPDRTLQLVVFAAMAVILRKGRACEMDWRQGYSTAARSS